MIQGVCARAGLRWALLLLLGFAPGLALASQVQAVMSSKAGQALLLDIVHAGPRLVAVGERGHILTSDDQGSSWQQSRVPSRQLLTAVFFVDGQRGWAVGHDAQILASDDAGATWHKQFEDLQRQAPLLDVWFRDRLHGLAVGAYGALLATDDGGEHWHDVSARLDNPDQLHLNAIAGLGRGGVIIAGEQGRLYRSSDDGNTWQTVHSPYGGSLFGVLASAQPGTVLAFGLRGSVLRSVDAGQHWHSVGLPGERGPLEFSLTGGTVLGDGSLVVVGNSGTVLRSQDNGQSFSLFNRVDRAALSAVAEGAPGQLLLVGQGGVRMSDARGADPRPREVRP